MQELMQPIEVPDIDALNSGQSGPVPLIDLLCPGDIWVPIFCAIHENQD